MFAWIASNMWTIVICIVLLGLIVWAARHLYKARKAGGCAGCPGCGSCSHCAGCGAAGASKNKSNPAAARSGKDG